ncbi:MAG: GNAT family N-acetyltransferase, partial [Candidatus Paceibacteria bacterium]
MIRLATLKDVEAILDIELTCFPDPETYKLNRNTIRYHVKKGDRLWVDYDRNTTCGYILLSHTSSRGQRRVYSVATHPNHQGYGIGKRLMKFAEKKTPRKLTLEVDCKNPGAIRLYEKLGYTVFGKYPNYYGRGHHAIR